MLNKLNHSTSTEATKKSKRKRYCCIESCKNYRGTECEIRMIKYVSSYNI